MPSQVYSVNTLGGYSSVPYLTDKLRQAAQPRFMFRQFLDAHEAVGKGKGDTWNFDKRGNVQTQGGALTETATIPETNFLLAQGTGSITEYGLSIPYTSKLDMLGKFDMPASIESALRDDMVKVLESAAGNEFTATELIAVCSATNSVVFTTNGTATATATADLTASNVQAIVNNMKKKLIPKYDGRNYMCIASVSALAGLYQDTAAGGWVTVSQYTAEYAKNIFNGEAGMYYGTRFVEETGYFSNTIGNGSTHGQAVFFGADNVFEAISVPEEIRHKPGVDFGRDPAIAWYALLGFKKVWSYSADSEQHIMYVTSA